MTAENETNLETLLSEEMSGDDFDAPESPEIETEPSESMEESILNAIKENGAEEVKETDPKRQDLTASEAASILAKSKGTRRPNGVPTAPAKVAEALPTGTKQEGPKYQPPARFNAEEKEWFNQQPAPVQKHVSDTLNGMQQHFTRVNQELAQQRTRYAELENIERTYMPAINTVNPRISYEAATREMFATQAKLLNPQTALAEASRIIASVGLTPQQIFDYQRGGQQQQSPVQQQSGLTEQQARALYREEQQKLQGEYAFNAAVSQLRQLKEERDSSGRYSWPELHDDAQIEALKPLTDYVQRTTGLGVVEATKAAIQKARGVSPQASPASNVNRASAQPNEMNRVRSAAVSVRPRANGAIPSSTGGKAGERMEDSILRAVAELSN